MTAAGYETLRPSFLAVNVACAGFMSYGCLHGMCSSRINCYRIPVGHPVVVSPPGVHAKRIESPSQVQGPETALTGKVCEPLHALFPPKNISFSLTKQIFGMTVHVYSAI